MRLTNRMVNFIVDIYERGYTTKKESTIGFPYYIIVWSLRDEGILKFKEINENNQKKWILTEKGLEIAKCLKRIKELIKV